MGRPGWRWVVLGAFGLGVLLVIAGFVVVQTAPATGSGDYGRFVLALLLWTLAALCGVTALTVAVVVAVLRLVRVARRWMRSLRGYRR